MKNYYDILKIKNTASNDEIKNAYRALAKKYHPDLNKAVGAKETLIEVNEAYDILGDDKKKADYDKRFADFQQRQKFGYSAKTTSNPYGNTQPYPKTGAQSSSQQPYGRTFQSPPPQFGKTFQPPPSQYGKTHTFANQTSAPPPPPPPPPPPQSRPNPKDEALQKHLREMEMKRAFDDGYTKGRFDATEKTKPTITQLQQELKTLSEKNTELYRQNLQYFSQIEKLNLEVKKEREVLEEQVQKIEKKAEEDRAYGGNCVKDCPNESEVENLKIEQTILTARVDRLRENVAQLEQERDNKDSEIKELNLQVETLNNHIDELDDYIDALTGETSLDEEFFEEDELAEE